MAKITPWEVSGEIDYEELLIKFGIEKIDKNLIQRIEKHTKELHPFLRREIFFAHRDLNWLLDEYEKGNKFYLYTGRGPSSGIHLGHLLPFLFTKWLQDKFDVELIIQITDDEKYLFKEISWEEIQKQTFENMKDLIALGFKPNNTKFIIDSKHIHYIYPLAIRIAKKITYSTAKAAFGFTSENNIGQIFYTSLQAAPAVLKSYELGKNIPCLIPHGVDQDPHFRVARDVYERLGYYKPASIQGKMLPALNGEAKSSSSKNNAIYLSDSEKEIREKVMKYMLTGGRETLEAQKKLGGVPELCVVFKYYYYLFENDDEKLEERKKLCKGGKLICGECKKELANRIVEFVKDHQNKREKIDDKYVKQFYYGNGENDEKKATK
ncbi:MAG: tryptophan--tRNA ligase [Candidatus Woesearchaeota archaeon]